LTAGILTFNILGMSILFGVSSGLNTLLTQAEGRGAETVPMRRLYVNRTVVVMFVTALPLALLNWFSGDILTATGQPARSTLADAQVPLQFNFVAR
jgi:MATE family multidrug resistance protein